MPLEQIRPVAALNSSESLRRQSYYDASSHASSSNQSLYSRDDAGSDSDRENANDDDDDNAYYDRFKRHSTSSVRSESMSLAKLGGVGGVTRSGSWGRNSLPDTSLTARHSLKSHHSSLARYQEEDDVEQEEQGAASSGSEQRSPDQHHSRVSLPPLHDGLLSRSGDQPRSAEAPASSRTSTASSAAAFSLRSLSDRNSTGSVSSLASSVVSRGSDSDRLSSTPPAESPVASVKPASDTTLTEASASASATAPSSPTPSPASHPSPTAESRATDPEDTSDVTSQGTADATTPSADPTMAAEQQPDQHSETRHASNRSSEASRDDVDTNISSTTPALEPLPTPLLQSPIAEPVLTPSAEELLSSCTPNVYSPLIPRRHSGAIMIRSRSQLALHPGLAMTFANAEGGRAAARERARKQTGWENAPFSVLEAQRHARAAAFSQPASPGSAAAAAPLAWDASAPAFALPPAVKVTEQETTRSPHSSPRPSNRPVPTSQTPPPLSLQSRSVESGESSRRPSLLPRQKSEHALSRAALARIDTVLGYQGNLEPTQSTSADAATLSMPVGVRNLPSRSPSGSAILGANGLLRTPTTEEWSRYLESQGVGLAGRRSRSGTNLSSSSAAQRTGRFGLAGLQSSSRTDLHAGAGDYDDDSDGDSDDSDDHDLGAEVLEKLKQLGLSRAASRAGSVLGDELSSLHEEDEDDFSPVSPQTDRILPLTDLEPLTPMASDKMALSQIQGGPLAFLQGSPSTPSGAPDRGVTGRMPRSKRPTLVNDALSGANLYPHDHKGDRSIADFEIVSDIGRGAYGLVKKARLRGPDGRAQGEEVIIKYIIKSRILADCWRRHRVLGPIPVEIHVMDQLRRIAYVPPTKPRPWAPNRPQTLEEYRARKRLEAEREGTQAEEASASTSTPTSHPNICRMLDFFEDHEFYYLVMPCFGRGQDLFDYVESAPDGLAAFQCRSIFGQVADALWFLHANNIVHRDIKDENVILNGEGHAQLIDFGSAAHVRPGKLFDTFSGTLDYAAAEILQGEKYAGQAQDVWALGVVGFVLLCGECPFWNGEEAVQGVEEGTRAAQTLKERCMIARGGPADPEGNLADKDIDMTPLDPAWSPCKNKEGADPDGGGRVDDFVDLISRCLELDPESRPSAEQICQHRFLAGFAGWAGHRGWQRLKAPIVPPCTVGGDGRATTTAPALSTAAL